MIALDRHFVEKPWGRTDVPAAFGAPDGARIGEIWYGTGAHVQTSSAAFPVLVKWLFTSEKLSIQVHPSDAEAQAAGLKSGKEECWYIVDAPPGAVIGLGTVRPLSADELRAASLSGEIEALMDWRPVKAGDYFYIPAGTVHAIGAGIILVEVQQYADITYRLYDYGRLDKGLARELHLDDAVAVAKAAPYADPRSGQAMGNMQLAEGPYFGLWLVEDAAALAAIPNDKPRWSVALAGEHFGQCALHLAGETAPFSGRQLVAAAA